MIVRDRAWRRPRRGARAQRQSTCTARLRPRPLSASGQRRCVPYAIADAVPRKYASRSSAAREARYIKCTTTSQLTTRIAISSTAVSHTPRRGWAWARPLGRLGAVGANCRAGGRSSATLNLDPPSAWTHFDSSTREVCRSLHAHAHELEKFLPGHCAVRTTQLTYCSLSPRVRNPLFSFWFLGQTRVSRDSFRNKAVFTIFRFAKFRAKLG